MLMIFCNYQISSDFYCRYLLYIVQQEILPSLKGMAANNQDEESVCAGCMRFTGFKVTMNLEYYPEKGAIRTVRGENEREDIKCV